MSGEITFFTLSSLHITQFLSFRVVRLNRDLSVFLQVEFPHSCGLGQDGRTVAAGERSRAAEAKDAPHDAPSFTQPHDREHAHVHRRRRHPPLGRDGPIGVGTEVSRHLIQNQSIHIPSSPLHLSLSTSLTLAARSISFQERQSFRATDTKTNTWNVVTTNRFRKWTYNKSLSQGFSLLLKVCAWRTSFFVSVF